MIGWKQEERGSKLFWSIILNTHLKLEYLVKKGIKLSYSFSSELR